KNIERPADTHNEWHVQSISMSCQKSLLARCGHSDEQTIRPTVTNLAHDFGFLFGGKVPIPQTSEANVRVFLERFGGGVPNYITGTAEKERSVVSVGTDG